MSLFLITPKKHFKILLATFLVLPLTYFPKRAKNGASRCYKSHESWPKKEESQTEEKRGAKLRERRKKTMAMPFTTALPGMRFKLSFRQHARFLNHPASTLQEATSAPVVVVLLMCPHGLQLVVRDRRLRNISRMIWPRQSRLLVCKQTVLTQKYLAKIITH